MLEVMKEYGWDYYTYGEQPVWVIQLAFEKLKIEAKLAEKANENASHA